MRSGFGLDTMSRSTWDAMTGRNFYSSANWLDFCAVEHDGQVDGVVGAGDDGAPEVALPLFRGADLPGSPFDWNALLTERSLPALPAEGFLAGPREGYQTHLLRAGAQSGAGARPSLDAVARLLAAARERAGDEACVAMYLGTPDVELLRAAGVTAPAVLMEPDAWIPVPEGGFDAWFAALGRKRRYSVRAEIAAFEEAGYRIEHVPLRECLTELVPLAVGTEAKHGYVATLDEDLASFRNHERCLGDAARVALCTLDGAPVGFCLYYVWQDAVFLRWAGFDYDRTGDAFEYFNLLYYEQLRWAAGAGIRWIHPGLKALQGKVARGAVLSPLWLLDLAAESPLAGAEDAVRRSNAAVVEELLADGTAARGVVDRAEWP